MMYQAKSGHRLRQKTFTLKMYNTDCITEKEKRSLVRLTLASLLLLFSCNNEHVKTLFLSRRKTLP